MDIVDIVTVAKCLEGASWELWLLRGATGVTGPQVPAQLSVSVAEQFLHEVQGPKLTIFSLTSPDPLQITQANT